VNDVDNEVIARNIIILEIISAINPDNLGDVEYLWDVWYNMTLTEGHHTRLKVTLERLLDGSGSSLWKFGDNTTKKPVNLTWKSWLETEPWVKENVEKSRQEFLEFYSRLRAGTSAANVTTMPAQSFYKNMSYEQWCTDGNLSKFAAEWNRVHKAGIARDFASNTVEFINPTLMRPGSSKWHVHYGSNPIAAYVPLER